MQFYCKLGKWLDLNVFKLYGKEKDLIEVRMVKHFEKV